MKLGGAVTVRMIVAVLVIVPERPEIVSVDVANAAAVLADSVRTLVVFVLAGLKDAVTPVANPDALNATVPVNPFSGVIVIVLVPLAPCLMLSVVAEDLIVKFGGVFTLRLILTRFVRLPETPVTVTTDVPTTAVEPAVRVNTLVPLVLVGLKDAVTPVGIPVAVNATVPAKPLVGFTVIVLTEEAPRLMLRVLGDAVSV